MHPRTRNGRNRYASTRARFIRPPAVLESEAAEGREQGVGAMDALMRSRVKEAHVDLRQNYCRTFRHKSSFVRQLRANGT